MFFMRKEGKIILFVILILFLVSFISAKDTYNKAIPDSIKENKIESIDSYSKVIEDLERARGYIIEFEEKPLAIEYKKLKEKVREDKEKLVR